MECAHFQEVLDRKTAVRIEKRSPRGVECFFPLINAPNCRKCHGADHIIRGVLHFEVSTQSYYQQIQNASAVTALIFGLAGAVIGASLILALRRIIIRPLILLGRTLQSVGGGDFEVRVEYGSNDELGQISEQTNAMIGGLKERTEELQLTQVELQEMKKHPHYGYDALRVAEESMGSTSFLRLARQIALSHH